MFNFSLFSILFIVFLIIVVGIYYSIPCKYQYIVLLIASYVFYLCAATSRSIIYLLCITIVSYVTGIIVDRINHKYHQEILDKTKDEQKEIKKKYVNHKNWIVTFGILIELIVLWYVKYYNFSIAQVNYIFNRFGSSINFPSMTILLPLGISFYTFQSIGYMIDVKKEKVPAETNLFKYALFVSYFPQIVQGPISKFSELANQLYASHQFQYDKVKAGALRMLWGYFKKIVIADRIAILVNEVFSNYAEQHYVGFVIFVAALLYGFQIFADFSGGIDIVLGVSEMLDIKLPENFKQPFFARSVAEFWQRWHITLGSWMKEYVFYPIALSKPFTNLGKRMRKRYGSNLGKVISPSIASFIVFFLVGLWHGADWKYVVYGLYQATFVSTASLFEKQYKQMRDWLHINSNSLGMILFTTIRTNLIITFGRYLSRGSSLPSALEMWRLTFSKYNPWIFFDGTLFQLGLNGPNFIFMIFCILFLLIIEYHHEKGISFRKKISELNIVLRWIIYISIIFAIIIFGVYGAEYSSSNFIYQGF